MLEIAPEKIAHIIVKSREYDAKVAAWNDSSDSSLDGGDGDTILESRRNDPTRRELFSFIATLNQDEKASLIALMWIGRGSFEPDELSDAVATATLEHRCSTARYLTGIPLLADYLEEGLEKLGFCIEDVEKDIL